jgi:hypothetical protein
MAVTKLTQLQIFLIAVTIAVGVTLVGGSFYWNVSNRTPSSSSSHDFSNSKRSDSSTVSSFTSLSNISSASTHSATPTFSNWYTNPDYPDLNLNYPDNWTVKFTDKRQPLEKDCQTDDNLEAKEALLTLTKETYILELRVIGLNPCNFTGNSELPEIGDDVGGDYDFKILKNHQEDGSYEYTRCHLRESNMVFCSNQSHHTLYKFTLTVQGDSQVNLSQEADAIVVNTFKSLV